MKNTKKSKISEISAPPLRSAPNFFERTAPPLRSAPKKNWRISNPDRKRPDLLFADDICDSVPADTNEMVRCGHDNHNKPPPFAKLHQSGLIIYFSDFSGFPLSS